MATQLTREQYRQLYGQNVPVSQESTLDTTPTPLPMTRAEYNEKYRPKELSFFADAAKDIRETGTALKETLGEGVTEAGQISQRVSTGDTGFTESVYQRFGSGLSTVGKGIFETIVGVGKALLPEKSNVLPSEQGIRDLATEVGKEFSERNKRFIEKLRSSDNPDDRKVAAQIDEFLYLYNSDENFKSTVNATGGIVDGLLSAVGFGPSTRATKKVAQTSIEAAEEALVRARQTADRVFTISDERVINKRVQDIFDIENSYSRTRKLNDALTDAGAESRKRIAATDVLVDAVDDTGVIRTTQKGGAVDQYKAQTVDGVEDIVKRVLIKENQKVNVNEVRDYLKTSIFSSGLEGEDLKRAINGVEREIEGLKLRADEFGNVLLAKIQDSKIATTKNINYRVDSTPTITLRKARASAYKELIEDKSGAPIKKINAELAKYYQDIERLRELDGKRVKGGRLGKHFATLGGQVVGGFAGSVGGPAGSGIGAIAGGELSAFLQSRAMKGAFGRSTRNLPDKNPILERAKRTAGEDLDLKVADPAVGVPEGVPQTALTRKLEKQIKDNVRQQKAAIKAGDFALVATLKDIYRSLVQRLQDYIENLDENIGLGLSIKSSVTPLSVAKKMDIEDVEEIRLFLEDPQGALLDDKLVRLIDEVGLAKADETTQIRFLRETLDEVNQLVDAGKHKLIEKGQKPSLLKRNQAQAPITPNTAQSITNTVDDVLDDVNGVSPQSATTKTTDLLEEARKYDSAEEFVRSQPIVYHGSPVPLEKFDNKKGGVFFTEDYYDATGFAGTPDNTYEGYLNFKKPLVVDAKGAKWDEINTPYGNSTQEVVSNASKDGYDGIVFKNIIDNTFDDAEVGTPGNIYYAYKPEDAFVNESQLEDIWKQANNK